MPVEEKFTLLRKILHALGLTKEAVDDIVDRILDWLSERDEEKSPQKIEYPYLIRDDFLSAAEISFYHVLKNAVADWAIVCPKIPLGDLFYVKTSDHSKVRTYTNKIDRKHVDFLLCSPKTMNPYMGVELDDKSHHRKDRQARDKLVDNIFRVTNLPLVRIPVKYTYSAAEVALLIKSYMRSSKPTPQPLVQAEPEIPKCPKCGTGMVLRTLKSGTNKGRQFWGCRNYPNCNGILNYTK